eukprot:1289038-Amphidinium_carterae.1
MFMSIVKKRPQPQGRKLVGSCWFADMEAELPYTLMAASTHSAGIKYGYPNPRVPAPYGMSTYNIPNAKAAHVPDMFGHLCFILPLVRRTFSVVVGLQFLVSSATGHTERLRHAWTVTGEALLGTCQVLLVESPMQLPLTESPRHHDSLGLPLRTQSHLQQCSTILAKTATKGQFRRDCSDTDNL